MAPAVQSSMLKLNECVSSELLYRVTVPVVAQLNDALILVRIGVIANSSASLAAIALVAPIENRKQNKRILYIIIIFIIITIFI